MPQGSERQVPPLTVSRWYGLMTNRNPHNIPAGAARQQVNCTSLVDGVLETRRGMVPVRFEN